MSSSTAHSTIGKLIIRAVLVLALIMGCAAIWSGAGLVARRDPNFAGAVSAVVTGLVIAVASSAALWRVWIFAAREQARVERVRRRHPGQPWMEREDWAARRVVHSGASTALGMWLWVAGWWGFSAIIGTVNRDKIVAAFSQSWGQAAMILAFVAVGLIGLAVAIRLTVSWRRYGLSTFEIDTLPAVMGGTLRGVLDARSVAARKQPVYASLVCEEHEWIRRGYGKDRETRLRVIELGKTSRVIEPGQIQPAGVRMRCPIEISVPTDLPASGVDQGGSGIRWILRVSAEGGGESFAATFEVPVYESNRTAPA